jgi:hypothetical protein
MWLASRFLATPVLLLQILQHFKAHALPRSVRFNIVHLLSSRPVYLATFLRSLIFAIFVWLPMCCDGIALRLQNVICGFFLVFLFLSFMRQ